MRAAAIVAVACLLGVGAPARADSDAGPGSAVVVTPPLEAGEPKVTAVASPSSVRLGATFTLFVTVTFAPGVEVNLREPLELGPAFEVRRRDSAERATADGQRVREYQLEVYAWDVGDLQVPPIAVTYTLVGRAGQVATNAVPVRVSGVLGAVVDDPKPRGDAPPAALLARDWLWAWIGGACGLVLTAAVVIALWRRGRRRPSVAGAAARAGHRLDSPGEAALAALLAVERSGALAAAPTRKAGYAAMVLAVRAYLGARYHVATADLTSDELVRALPPGAERAQVEAWLASCDLVKYGGLRATAEAAHAVLAAARALVVATSGAPSGAPALAPAIATPREEATP